METFEVALREEAAASRSERLRMWREWLKTCWKNKPRTVYGWLNGGGTLDGSARRHWGQNEPPVSVTARVRKAEQEWGDLWHHAAPYVNSGVWGC